MSDIPDWLVELAAQGEPDEEEEADSASEQAAYDPSNTFTFDPEPQTVVEPISYVEPVDEDEASEDVMDVLRTEVEAEVAEEEAAEAEAETRRSFSLRLPGLLPWQQLILTILLFLDVIVIGLLILVMLGRVSLP